MADGMHMSVGTSAKDSVKKVEAAELLVVGRCWRRPMRRWIDLGSASREYRQWLVLGML
jgi:hypothetical protein